MTDTSPRCPACGSKHIAVDYDAVVTVRFAEDGTLEGVILGGVLDGVPMGIVCYGCSSEIEWPRQDKGLVNESLVVYLQQVGGFTRQELESELDGPLLGGLAGGIALYDIEPREQLWGFVAYGEAP